MMGRSRSRYRQIARDGSADRRRLIEARRPNRFFHVADPDQIEAIRRARRDGPIPVDFSTISSSIGGTSFGGGAKPTAPRRYRRYAVGSRCSLNISRSRVFKICPYRHAEFRHEHDFVGQLPFRQLVGKEVQQVRRFSDRGLPS